MKEHKYSAIVFDLGNVLIPFNYDTMMNKLEKVKPGLGNKFLEFYRNNYYLHREFERGDLPIDDFLGKMLDICENMIDKDTFCRYYSEIFTVNEGVVSLLPLLKEKGYKLFLLSNTNEIHREYGYKQYSFLNYFDKLFLSYEVGAIKPEPGIYDAVVKYSGFPPGEHLFIDDIFEYAEGARKAGWDAIHFLNYEQLDKELKDRAILPAGN